MRAWRVLISLALALGLTACGAPVPPATMPNVVGSRLDIAKSDIKRAGVGDKVEVLGGGLFGILDESNWMVCEQLPLAGATVTETPRLTVDRSCDGEGEATPSTAPTQSPQPDQAATTPVEPTFPSPETIDVITVENNEEFAALQSLGDYCSPTISDFAQTYRGRAIQFDGSIGAINNHGSARTRYDILINFGDDGLGTKGPNFQFRDVNTTYDLHYTTADGPDSIGVGTNLRVTARVDKYIENQCLLLIEPVSTGFR